MKNLLPQGMIQKIVFALLFITGALLYAQLEKTYISSQTNQVYGICVGCAVGDPQNIVGNNENNYETLRMPIGVLGRIEQNLNFPKLAPAYRKVTIGIETPNVSIKEQAKREIYIETFKDNVSNHPPMRVDISMLKPSSNSQKGTIEFTTTRPFDRIKLSVHSGLVGVGEEIRIYYMHHLPAPFTACGNPPLDPLAYYSFDGNTNDIISDYNLIGSGFDFLPNDMICGSAIYADSNQKLLKMFFKGNKIKTIAFWVKADNPSGDTSLRPKFTIHTNKMFIEGENFLSQSFKIYLKEQVTIYPLFKERAIDTIEYDEFTHLIITYNEETNQACIYKNGLLSDIYETRSCGAFENFTFPTNKSLGITLRNTKIDELLLYDRALTRDEVKALACSYGKLPNCTPGTLASASKITTSTETFTVSPNPTTGEITLDGNILLVGSDISIRNTSGTEVYRSAFRSKTFELPATLPGGVYILTLQTKDKKVYTRKIILTR